MTSLLAALLKAAVRSDPAEVNDGNLVAFSAEPVHSFSLSGSA